MNDGRIGNLVKRGGFDRLGEESSQEESRGTRDRQEGERRGERGRETEETDQLVSPSRHSLRYPSIPRHQSRAKINLMGCSFHIWQ